MKLKLLMRNLSPENCLPSLYILVSQIVLTKFSDLEPLNGIITGLLNFLVRASPLESLNSGDISDLL